MEYGGFIFAAFVALIGVIIALVMFYQDRQVVQKHGHRHA